MKASLARFGSADSAFGVARPPLVLVSVLALATVAALTATGNPAIALVPLVLFLLLYALFKIELRASAVILMFLCLALEGPVGGPGDMEPLYIAGGLFMYNLNIVTHIDALAFSGNDVIVGCLWLVILYRKATSQPLSGPRNQETARVLVSAALIAALGLLLLLGIGLARGGDLKSALWQCRVLFYLSTMVLLYQAVLRGPEDHVLLARVLIWTACFRAVLCILIARNIKDPDYNCATSHGNSITFAMACFVLIAHAVETGRRGPFLRALLILPLLFAGMLANHRRLVWVELAATGAFLLFFSRSRLARNARRSLVVLVPALTVYVILGLNSSSRIFAPVHTFNSVSSSADASTEYRDTENYNLLGTLASDRLMGIGLGQEYYLIKPNYDITFFKQWRYLPHNMIVGLWAFTGLIGVSLIWFMLPIGVFLSARTYHFASRPIDRTAALCGVASVIIYQIQCFGDIGTGAWTSVFVVAPALAANGKLAVAVGAWPSVKRRAERDADSGARSQELRLLPANATAEGRRS